MAPLRSLLLLPLLLLHDLSIMSVLAEEAAAEAAAEAAPAADESAKAPAEGEAAAEEESPKDFAASMQELQDKMGQLKGLLEKRGDVDPALRERLEGLTKQLNGLGIGGGDGGAAARKAEQSVLTACLTLSLASAGPKKSSTFKAMGRLASGRVTKEEAADMELMKLVAVCVTGLSDKEYKKYTAGNLFTLPKHLTDKAAGKTARDEVLALESEIENVWKQIGDIAKPLYDTMREATGKGALPMWYGLVAAVPLIGAVGFLGKKFFDLQKSQEAAAEAKRLKREERRKEK